jgi:uncharacterized protein (TIGR03067 family)
MRTSALVLLATALALTGHAAPAPLPRPDTGKEDLKRMQGTWLRTSCTSGLIPPVPRPVNDIVVISGNQITYGAGKFTWNLTLGTGKAPRAFDIRRGEGARATVWSGLYELKGDTLHVCFTPGRVRPRSMRPAKMGEYLQTFKRRKP